MSTIYDWSTTPGSNATADSAINWSEGMFPSVVNDSARQMMGRLAEYVKDNGVLTAVGTNTIAITSNAPITAVATGMTLAFRAAATNTTAVTLNLNGLGGQQIRKVTAGDTDSVPLVAGDINIKGVYVVNYDSTTNGGAGAWVLMNPALNVTPAGIGAVAKAGDTMTGLLTLSGAPTTNLHAATKLYVDTADNLKVAKSGDTMTGALSIATGAGSNLLIENTAASVNTALQIKNTAGSFYIGRSGSSFYISENASIGTNPMLQVATSGLTTISTSTGSPLTVANTAASINTAIQYTNTAGTLYAGISAGTYYVSDTATLTSSPRISINSSGVLSVASQIEIGATGIVSSSGNLLGSFWADWGSITAKTAIDNRIDAKIATAPAVGTIGSYAMLRSTSSRNTGEAVPGSSLTYSDSSANTSGGNPPGNWRCMGRCLANEATLWVRYS